MRSGAPSASAGLVLLRLHGEPRTLSALLDSVDGALVIAMTFTQTKQNVDVCPTFPPLDGAPLANSAGNVCIFDSRGKATSFWPVAQRELLFCSRFGALQETLQALRHATVTFPTHIRHPPLTGSLGDSCTSGARPESLGRI